MLFQPSQTGSCVASPLQKPGPGHFPAAPPPTTVSPRFPEPCLPPHTPIPLLHTDCRSWQHTEVCQFSGPEPRVLPSLDFLSSQLRRGPYCRAFLDQPQPGWPLRYRHNDFITRASSPHTSLLQVGVDQSGDNAENLCSRIALSIWPHVAIVP